MSAGEEQWTEWIVRCRRWVRNLKGEKVWETVDLPACDEGQARSFYKDIRKGDGALEDPTVHVRTITERKVKM